MSLIFCSVVEKTAGLSFSPALNDVDRTIQSITVGSICICTLLVLPLVIMCISDVLIRPQHKRKPGKKTTEQRCKHNHVFDSTPDVSQQFYNDLEYYFLYNPRVT